MAVIREVSLLLFKSRESEAQTMLRDLAKGTPAVTGPAESAPRKCDFRSYPLNQGSLLDMVINAEHSREGVVMAWMTASALPVPSGSL